MVVNSATYWSPAQHTRWRGLRARTESIEFSLCQVSTVYTMNHKRLQIWLKEDCCLLLGSWTWRPKRLRVEPSYNRHEIALLNGYQAFIYFWKSSLIFKEAVYKKQNLVSTDDDTLGSLVKLVQILYIYIYFFSYSVSIGLA